MAVTPMTQTPKGLRLHFGIFGRTNAGKSTLMNALAGQDVSIVSEVAGTTTDAVEKACELIPVGPVVFIDTAGIDDEQTPLGRSRVKRSMGILEWVDVAILVLCEARLGAYERKVLDIARGLGTPVVAVLNKSDVTAYPGDFEEALKNQKLTVVRTDARTGEGTEELREALVSIVLQSVEPDRAMFEGTVDKGDTVLLVTPMDTGAPKGRLILPQVQAIREILDKGARAFVVREDEVARTLALLKEPPRLVVTDSQVVARVDAEVNPEIAMTTFSIELAFTKSDLTSMARGVAALAALKSGDKVLIAETCSHNPFEDDIGRVKIPRWLRERFGEIGVDFAVGKDFPDDLSPYKAVIQCGGCMVSRKHMLARLRWAASQGVAMTNYGVAIAFLQGALPRALGSHPEAQSAYLEAMALQKD